MAQQSYRMHKTQKVQNEDSTTSQTQTLSLIAQNRMQHIWITFIDGVKGLYNFAVCLNKPIFESRRLQELSRKAREKINLAEQDIHRGEKDIKDEIHRLVLLRQGYEEDMEDLNNKINALSHKTIKKKRKIQTATDEVDIAERQLETHIRMKYKAQIVNALATGGTFFLTKATSCFLGKTVGRWAHTFGKIITEVTHSKQEKSEKAVKEKIVELEEREKKLSERKITLNHISEEIKEKQIKLNNLEISYEKLLDYSKLLTKLKSCISQCHDYINITLGRVVMLNERQKIEIIRENIKQMIEKLVEHLLDVQSWESHFPIMQQLKTMTLEMQSICTKPMHKAEQTINSYWYIEGCFCSYCFIGILLSSIQSIFVVTEV